MRLWIGVAAFVLLVASFGLRFYWFAAPPAVPPLILDLGDSRAPGAQDVFLARLAQKFPVGAKEDALIAELRTEGFRIDAGAHSAAFDRSAKLDDKCRRGATIQWSADNGAITSLTGHY